MSAASAARMGHVCHDPKEDDGWRKCSCVKTLVCNDTEAIRGCETRCEITANSDA